MSDETRDRETVPEIRLGPPLSVKLKSADVSVVVRIVGSNVTSMPMTGVLRGLGETGAIVAAMTVREVEASEAAWKLASPA